MATNAVVLSPDVEARLVEAFAMILRKAVDQVTADCTPQKPSRTLMSMEDLAEYLRYTGAGASNAAYHWTRRNGVRRLNRGNAVLVWLSDVNDALNGVDVAARRAKEAAAAEASQPPRRHLRAHRR